MWYSPSFYTCQLSTECAVNFVESNTEVIVWVYALNESVTLPLAQNAAETTSSPLIYILLFCAWSRVISRPVSKPNQWKEVSDWLSESDQSHSPIEEEWPVIVTPLHSSKRRPHFRTQKPYNHGSQRCPKLQLTVLTRTNRNLLDWARLYYIVEW
jgi:hypothetical protein